MQRMYCTKCGNLLPPDAIFCGECGTRRETESLDKPTIVSQPYPPEADPAMLTKTMDADYLSQRPVQRDQTPPYNQNIFPSDPHAGQIYLPGSSETKQRTSRRIVLVGLLGVAGLAATGGVIGWLLHSSEQSQIGSIHSTYKGHLYSVGTVAWAPNGRRIASGSHDVQIWDPSNGEHILSYRRHQGDVQSVSWSPDGNSIVSGSNDQTVRTWDANSGNTRSIFQGHTGVVWAVAWSPNGKYIASASSDKKVDVWDATTGLIRLFYRGHTDVAYALAFSPDSRRLASGSFDKTVQVWDTTTARNVNKYLGHSDKVNAVAWSPDGNSIASGSSDQSVQVWQAT